MRLFSFFLLSLKDNKTNHTRENNHMNYCFKMPFINTALDVTESQCPSWSTQLNTHINNINKMMKEQKWFDTDINLGKMYRMDTNDTNKVMVNSIIEIYKQKGWLVEKGSGALWFKPDYTYEGWATKLSIHNFTK